MISLLYQIQLLMNTQQVIRLPLKVKSTTWYKDSHSLYDYQSPKLTTKQFHFNLAENISFYRKKNSSSEVVACSDNSKLPNQEDYDFLAYVTIEPLIDSQINLNIYNRCIPTKTAIGSEKTNTEESISSIKEKEEEPFIIVSKFKDSEGKIKGYKLIPSMTLKLGRIQFLVTEVSSGGQIEYMQNKGKIKNYYHKSSFKFEKIPEDKNLDSCKICLEKAQTEDNFLLMPCSCTGSCGTVHYECLKQWINFKVKKQVIGGTLHYNFQKFQCEICKKELPMVIDYNGVEKEILSIEKPKDSYLILQGACQKEKSIIILQNIPEAGIKIGRGHDCQIRITDISVSRSHAHIRYSDNQFRIYDNKSKFGTLINKEDLQLTLEHNQSSNSIQIGRTVLDFQIQQDKLRSKRNS